MTKAQTPPAADQHLPWIRTPLLESKALSREAGSRIFMKMEMLQPSGSFKSRGVGNLISKAVQSRPPSSKPVKIYSSSGGNAGLAAVSASTIVHHPCTVVVPESTTEYMKSKIRAAGGEVITHGTSWQEADELVQKLVNGDEGSVYAIPFDHPDIWEGNSTIIDEVVEDLGGAPDAIIVSVGGGGLLAGVILGLDRHGLSDIPVIAVETFGADSLHASLEAGHLVSLPAITSKASSLGAKRVAEKAYELAKRESVHSQVMTDAQAARACVKLLDDERVAVELACGVSAAVVYEGVLRKVLPKLKKDSRVVVVVCGGSNINLETLATYEKEYCS